MDIEERERVIRAILETAPLMKKTLWRPMELPNHGMPHSQHFAMHLLCEHDALNMTQLSEKMKVSNQQMTKVIEGLVKKGYVERHLDPSNRRLVLIKVTEKGADFMKAQQTYFVKQFLPEFDHFSDEEMRTIDECFTKIREIFSKERI